MEAKPIPTRIETVDQIDALGKHSELWDKSFVLTASIDMQGGIYPYVNAVVTGPFTGNFDGNGHKITNLVIKGIHKDRPGSLAASSSSSSPPLGLFKVLGVGRKNRPSHCGGCEHHLPQWPFGGLLAWENQGAIVDCRVSGTIKNASVGGGLVAINSGTITNSRSNASVSASQAGGLAGLNDGTIVDCCASGSVTGSSTGGGFGRGKTGAVSCDAML